MLSLVKVDDTCHPGPFAFKPNQAAAEFDGPDPSALPWLQLSSCPDSGTPWPAGGFPAGGLCGLNHFAGVEHFHVQGERQQRMEQAPVVMGQRVLEVAKVGQCMANEGLELHQGFTPIQWPAELACIRVPHELDTASDKGFPKR